MSNLLADTVKQVFTKEFNTQPVLIFSPGRINIIGEHTDYNDGFVFPAAVDKGITAAIQKTDANQSTAYALDKESKITFNIDKLTPLEEGSWENYVFGVISEIQKKGKTIGNFNFVFSGDVPSGAGMSSSAALENSVAYGLNEIFELGFSKEEMIIISQQAEHNYAGVKCGIMDQYASMFGIKDHALLLDCRTIKATPFKIDFEDYRLLLINTNVKHSLSDSAYNDRRSVCESTAKLLNKKALRDAKEDDLFKIKDQISDEDFEKAMYVVQENKRAKEASIAMETKNLRNLGDLIYGSHAGLSKKYKVSCDELDFLVQKAKTTNYILGARMMGGGFGGCTLNLIKKGKENDFKDLVSDSYRETFGMDCSFYEVNLSDGTHVIQ